MGNERLVASDERKSCVTSNTQPDPSKRQQQQHDVNKGGRSRDIVEPKAAEILKAIPGFADQMLTNKHLLNTARVVTENEEIHKMILKYIKNGLDQDFGINVLNILQVSHADEVHYLQHQSMRNKERMLLWHGTNENNVASILLNGFRLPASSGSQIFGPGLYFADRSSNSADYSGTTEPGTTGYLLLCDVVVGKAYEAFQSEPRYTSPPEGNDSVKGMGYCIPNSDVTWYKGSCVPYGRSEIVYPLIAFTPVEYNEYVVYSPKNVKLLFLIHFEFTMDSNLPSGSQITQDFFNVNLN